MSSSDEPDFKPSNRKRLRTASMNSDHDADGITLHRPSPAAAKKLCNLCQTEAIPDMDSNHKQLLEYDNLRAHYFCLLFSSGLGQSGLETEGLHGFMPADVRREIKRGARLKCVYCKKKGATVGCARQACKKSYHLPCGMSNGSLQEHFDQVST